VSWHLLSPERNLPPEAFQERLTALGGLNRYDQPNFRIWWAAYGADIGSYVAGGAWSVDEATFVGYRRLLTASGEACWSLFQWNPPECYGTPESYYVQNYDEATGLQTLGGYPYEGRWEVLYNLRWHEIVNGKLQLFTMPLSTWLFDQVIPIIIKAKELSYEKGRAAYLEMRQADEDRKTARIEQHLRANALPFKDAISYGRQGIRSTVIDKKRLELQREWANLASIAKSFKKGLQVR